MKLVVPKCYLTRQCLSACIAFQQGGQHHLLLSIEITDLEKLRNFYLGQYLLVIWYPTFMKHVNFDAKAQLSVKGSMNVSYCGGLVMRMDTHLDQTWNQFVLHSEQTSIQILFFPSALRSQGISFSWRSKDLLSQSAWTEIREHCDSLCEYTFLKELGWISPLEESLPLPTSIPPSAWSMCTVYRGAMNPNSLVHLNHFHGIWMLLGDLGDTAFDLTIDDI